MVVFASRYLDLFTHYVSLYNSVMKILYLSATAYIIYMIRYKQPFKSQYEWGQDSFLHWQFAVAPCAIAAVITQLVNGFSFLEVQSTSITVACFMYDASQLFWYFSLYLEAISILPQLIVLQRYREVENLTANYVLFLGAYRALYILNWIYRSYYEKDYKHNWILYACGIVQTALYVDFFYYYALSKYKGRKLKLPS
jgi:ER lumen protein retaining receptor